MKLGGRYRRLSLWNKLAVWGSLASVVGVGIALVPIVSGGPAHASDDPYNRAMLSGNRDSIMIQTLAGLNGPRFALREMSLGVSVPLTDSTLRAGSFPPLQPGVWTVASRTLLAIQSSTRQTQCFVAPAGRRIVGYRVEILRSINTAETPESFVRVISASPNKVCYEWHVTDDGKRCKPPVYCSLIPPAVYWRVLARVDSVDSQ